MKKVNNLSFILTLCVLTLCAAFVFFGCSDDKVVTTTQSASPTTSTYDSRYAVEWMWLTSKIVADQSRDNPPQAGRIYSYACIAIYQCVVPGMPLNRSLRGQLNGMPQMPAAYLTSEYDWPSVLTGAMPVMLRGLFRTLYNPSNVMINNIYDRQKQERLALKDAAIIDRSIQYGEDVANRLLEWVDNDGFNEIQGLPYVPPPRTLNPANWEPVNPGDTAVEPYWGTLRTYALPGADYDEVPPSFGFDSTVNSPFYNDEYEVYQIRANATQEQKDIALFWRDKQLTPQPPGHWVSILNQIVLRDNIKLDRAAECYAYLGIAIGDAFIAAWYTKYKFNYLRPQTYIRDYIQEGWTPFLPTPPFPDYPSGHSTSSGACSYVLTHLLGTVAFTDTTHLRIGMSPRSFNSFYEAAVECSNSRIYGGIHYRNACENGVIMGENIGQTIVNRIRLKFF
ncbi:MAG: vanadium-dependent haloperoxidase [Chlorobi bacterium]|nr:vanadium-dependent haloperoxidase [Chlorobiota bacterium]MCI0715799.1 vanadium-dependent haloperoxidase [Chlorobiota bacterium]